MRYLMVAVLALAGGESSLIAQDDPPQVDQAEVMRLGDTVQHVGNHTQGEAYADAFVAAMSPPESDADKWFISVLSMQRCAACERLKREWATNEWLLALGNPADPDNSWAHYTVYDKDDESQAYRFENIEVTAYPTILVQPPRSGRYGDASTVVYQGVYQGDPERLARAISSAIRRYIARLQSLPGLTQVGQAVAVQSDPPWQPVPIDDPLRPQPTPIFPIFDPTIPPATPEPEPDPAPVAVAPFPWSAVFTLVAAGFSVPAAIALVVWAMSFLRSRRQARGKPLLMDQATFDQVLVLLQQFADGQPPQSSSGT